MLVFETGKCFMMKHQINNNENGDAPYTAHPHPTPQKTTTPKPTQNKSK